MWKEVKSGMLLCLAQKQKSKLLLFLILINRVYLMMEGIERMKMWGVVERRQLLEWGGKGQFNSLLCFWLTLCQDLVGIGWIIHGPCLQGAHDMKELVVRRLVYSCFHQEIQLLRQNRCFMFPNYEELYSFKTFYI